MNDECPKSKLEPNPKHGKFSEEPETMWMTEEDADRRMCLLREFNFRDPDGLPWITPNAYKVDGASIPWPLWSLVGSPYTGNYRRASIVHDRACDIANGDRTARSKADRMFYHACRAGGCSIYDATLLYIGVRIGAWMPDVPAWNAAARKEYIGPRLSRSTAEEQVENDYRRIAEIVLNEGEIDDPIILEGHVDAALSTITGVSL